MAGRDVRILGMAPRDDEVDRCVALELGADDVVDRPSSVRETVLRVRALLRRTPAPVG